MSSNDVSLETFKNNKQKTYVIGYILMGLMIMAIAAAGASNGGVFLAFGIAGILGGAYLMYMGYETLVDPRNERRCDTRDLLRYANMEIPANYLNGDAGVDTEIDTDERTILMKVIYSGYGGVYLRSNNAGESIGGNFDAWYIPGNAKATLTEKLGDLLTESQVLALPNGAHRLYVMNKGDYRVEVKDRSDKTRLYGLSPSPKPPYFVSACDATT